MDSIKMDNTIHYLGLISDEYGISLDELLVVCGIDNNKKSNKDKQFESKSLLEYITLENGLSYLYDDLNNIVYSKGPKQKRVGKLCLKTYMLIIDE